MATKNKIQILDISDPPPKKLLKKKSPPVTLPKRISREKAVALSEEEPSSPRKRVSKLNTKGMRSILGDAAEDIQQMLESNNNESAVSLMQKRMMQTVVDLIPYAEHAVRKSKGARGVYQINSLITSLRELMIDMQSTRDKGAIGDSLIEKVIRPVFLDIGMELILEDEKMLKSIKEIVPFEDYKSIRTIHQDSLARVAKAVQLKYSEAKQGAISFLQQ